MEQQVFPQIIGRPTNTQRVIEQAGQRAQEIQKAAAQDIEQFVAEQAAAETADIIAAIAGGAFEGARAGASAFPTPRNLGRAGGAAVGGLGAATLGLGLGAVGGAYEGARYMLGGNAAMAVRQTIKRPTSERSTTCNKGPRSNRSA